MIPTMLLMIMSIFMSTSNINMIRTTGFAGPDDMIMLSFFGLVIGLSLLIPALRQMYYWVPWLYPFVKIFLINVAILIAALTVLNFGYQVQNPARHTIFFILTIGTIILGRTLMGFYFYRKNVEHIEGATDEREKA